VPPLLQPLMSEILKVSLWLAFSIFVLVVVSNWVSLWVQRILFYLTGGNQRMTIWLNQIVFFPGVLLHEMSHWFAAKLLGVPTGRMSVLPDSGKNGMITLGYVEVSRTDFIREFLIGIAPLVSGTAVALGLGNWYFSANSLGLAMLAGDWAAVSELLREIWQKGDLWLFAYLLFSVSNTMLPSASDRRAWMPLLGFLLVMGAIFYFLGIVPFLVQWIRPLLAWGITVLATGFTITIIFDLFILPILYLIGALLEQLRGR